MVKLSIITPYYKTLELTKKLMDRFIPQLNEKTEYIIVDDGCNETQLDLYLENIKGKEHVKVIHLKENVGGASAMNVALKKSIGEYIAIIDSDDLVTNDYIETLLETIDEHSEDVIFFDWQDIHSKIIVHHPHNYAPWKAIYKKKIIPMFRDGWIYSYDVPFQDDLDKTNYTRYYIDKVLYYYNSNRPNSLTLLKKEAIKKENTK